MHDNAASSSPVNAYYGQTSDIATRAFDALRAMGKDLDALTIADLAPLDQFHIGGIDSTRALAQLGEIRSGENVIDLGGGLGGPARVLAGEFGAQVTVVDITEEFVRAGTALTEQLGLGRHIHMHHGDAVAVPFADNSFDVAWTQHATMNIADKERLYAEIRRVLRPGGRLVFHEVMAGSGGPVLFPVPWAPEESISHLRPSDEVRNLLMGALGFVETAWLDVTADARAWLSVMRERAAQASQSPLGLHLVMGADREVRFATLGRNLQEDRVRVVQAVYEKAIDRNPT